MQVSFPELSGYVSDDDRQIQISSESDDDAMLSLFGFSDDESTQIDDNPSSEGEALFSLFNLNEGTSMQFEDNSDSSEEKASLFNPQSNSCSLPTPSIESPSHSGHHTILVTFRFKPLTNEDVVKFKLLPYNNWNMMEKIQDTFQFKARLRKAFEYQYCFLVNDCVFISPSTPKSEISPYEKIFIPLETVGQVVLDAGNEKIQVFDFSKDDHDSINEQLENQLTHYDFTTSDISTKCYKVYSSLCKDKFGRAKVNLPFKQYSKNIRQPCLAQLDLGHCAHIDFITLGPEFECPITTFNEMDKDYRFTLEYLKDSSWEPHFKKLSLSKLADYPYANFKIPVSLNAQIFRLSVTAASQSKVNDTDKGIIKSFRFSGKNFDKNGFFYWLGTNYLNRYFSLNSINQCIQISPRSSLSSSFLLSQKGSSAQKLNPSNLMTIIYDLGSKYALKCNAWSIRYINSSNAMFSMRLSGSTNKKAWYTLHSIDSDPTQLHEDTVTYSFNTANQYYKYLLVEIDPRPLHVPILNIEFYGDLMIYKTKNVKLTSIGISLESFKENNNLLRRVLDDVRTKESPCTPVLRVLQNIQDGIELEKNVIDLIHFKDKIPNAIKYQDITSAMIKNFMYALCTINSSKLPAMIATILEPLLKYETILNDIQENICLVLLSIEQYFPNIDTLDVFMRLLQLTWSNRLSETVLTSLSKLGKNIKQMYSEKYAKLCMNGIEDLVLEKYMYSPRPSDIVIQHEEQEITIIGHDEYELLLNSIDELQRQILINDMTQAQRVDLASKILILQSKIRNYLLSRTISDQNGPLPSANEDILHPSTLDRLCTISESLFTVAITYLDCPCDETCLEDIFENFCIFSPRYIKLKAISFIVNNIQTSQLPITIINKYINPESKAYNFELITRNLSLLLKKLEQPLIVQTVQHLFNLLNLNLSKESVEKTYWISLLAEIFHSSQSIISNSLSQNDHIHYLDVIIQTIHKTYSWNMSQFVHLYSIFNNIVKDISPQTLQTVMCENPLVKNLIISLLESETLYMSALVYIEEILDSYPKCPESGDLEVICGIRTYIRTILIEYLKSERSIHKEDRILHLLRFVTSSRDIALDVDTSKSHLTESIRSEIVSLLMRIDILTNEKIWHHGLRLLCFSNLELLVEQDFRNLFKKFARSDHHIRFALAKPLERLVSEISYCVGSKLVLPIMEHIFQLTKDILTYDPFIDHLKGIIEQNAAHIHISPTSMNKLLITAIRSLPPPEQYCNFKTFKDISAVDLLKTLNTACYPFQDFDDIEETSDFDESESDKEVDLFLYDDSKETELTESMNPLISNSLSMTLVLEIMKYLQRIQTSIKQRSEHRFDYVVTNLLIKLLKHYLPASQSVECFIPLIAKYLHVFFNDTTLFNHLLLILEQEDCAYHFFVNAGGFNTILVNFFSGQYLPNELGIDVSSKPILGHRDILKQLEKFNGMISYSPFHNPSSVSHQRYFSNLLKTNQNPKEFAFKTNLHGRAIGYNINFDAVFTLKSIEIVFKHIPLNISHPESIAIETSVGNNEFALAHIHPISIDTLKEDDMSNESRIKIRIDICPITCNKVRISFNRYASGNLNIHSIDFLGSPCLHDTTHNLDSSKLCTLFNTMLLHPKTKQYIISQPSIVDILINLLHLPTLNINVKTSIISTMLNLPRDVLTLDILNILFQPDSIAAVSNHPDIFMDLILNYEVLSILIKNITSSLQEHHIDHLQAYSKIFYHAELLTDIEKFQLSLNDFQILVRLSLQPLPAPHYIRWLLLRLLAYNPEKYLSVAYDTILLKESDSPKDNVLKIELLLMISATSPKALESFKTSFLPSMIKNMLNNSDLADLAVEAIACAIKGEESKIVSCELFLDMLLSLYFIGPTKSTTEKYILIALNRMISLNPLGIKKVSSFLEDVLSNSPKDSAKAMKLYNIFEFQEYIDICLIPKYPYKHCHDILSQTPHSMIWRTKNNQPLPIHNQSANLPNVVKKDDYKRYFYLLHPSIPRRGLTSFDFEISTTVDDDAIAISIERTDSINRYDGPFGSHSYYFQIFHHKSVESKNQSIQINLNAKVGNKFTFIIDMDQKKIEVKVDDNKTLLTLKDIEDAEYVPIIGYKGNQSTFSVKNFRTTGRIASLVDHVYRTENTLVSNSMSTLQQIADEKLLIHLNHKSSHNKYDIQFYHPKTNEPFPKNIPLRSILKSIGNASVPIHGDTVDLLYTVTPRCPEEQNSSDKIKKDCYPFLSVIRSNGLLLNYISFLDLKVQENFLTAKPGAIFTYKDFIFWKYIIQLLWNNQACSDILEEKHNKSILNSILLFLDPAKEMKDLHASYDDDFSPIEFVMSFLKGAIFKFLQSDDEPSKEFIKEALLLMLLYLGALHSYDAVDMEENGFIKDMNSITKLSTLPKETETESPEENNEDFNPIPKGKGYSVEGHDEGAFRIQDYLKKQAHIFNISVLIGEILLHILEPNVCVPELFNDVIKIIQQSNLRKIIIGVIHSTSIMDVTNAFKYYQTMFSICIKMFDHEALKMMLLSNKDLKKASRIIASSLSVTNMKSNLQSLKNLRSSQNIETNENHDNAENVHISIVEQTIQEIYQVLQYQFEWQKQNELRMSGNSIQLQDSGHIIVSSLESDYIEQLSELQFGEINLFNETTNEYASFYAKEISDCPSPSPKKAKRIIQELAVLSTSLPLHPDSSAFVRVDENRMDVLQVLITGPKGTPYQNGCFLFDVFLPDTYPNQPPKVNLCTTGKGSVRFNPNLYASGKVCLSLLGTWSGGKNEVWHPESSTLLQVIVSIQSLIFIDEPYFNEPSYESQYGTPNGKIASDHYNANIRKGTIKWAIEDMKENPPKGFDEIIQKHFELKNQEIEEQLKEWNGEQEVKTSTD